MLGAEARMFGFGAHWVFLFSVFLPPADADNPTSDPGGKSAVGPSITVFRSGPPSRKDLSDDDREQILSKQKQGLILRGYKLSPSDWKRISATPNLSVLDLYNSNATDRNLESFSSSPRLEVLNLGCTDITDAGVLELVRLRTLRNLDISFTATKDDGIALLSALQNLRVLNLSGTGVGGSSLKRLSLLQHLQKLDLSRTRIQDADLAILQEM